MIQPIRWTFALAACSTCFASVSNAQVCAPAYSVQPQVVFEKQLEQRMRVSYVTEYVDQDVVSTRLVPKVRTEKRTYNVTKPVVETSTVQERYTVMMPVKKRKWIDRSYDETSFVTETQDREETYTTYRPITETTYQSQNRVVQRPVTETQVQTQQYTTYQPVTTYQNAVVDQGQYVAQTYFQPGNTRYGLGWMPRGYQYDANGLLGYRRGGLGWTPYTSPGTTYAQLQYQPNPVQVAVPQTTLRPQVVEAQIPYQVTRLKSEVVQEQIPVTRTRMEAVQQVRKVPHSVQRPVTRRVTRAVPVDEIEYVKQEMVRPKTVTRTSYKVETVERDVEVTTYETQEFRTTVKVPRRVARYEPVMVEKTIARTVHSPVVLSYYDAYSAPISQGISSWLPSTIAPSQTVRYGAGVPAPADDAARTSAKPELKKLENAAEIDEDSESPSDGGLDLMGSDGDEAPTT